MAERVFDVDREGKSDEEAALEGIERMSAFWTSLGAPTRLADYEIDGSKIDMMAEKAMVYGEFGNFNKLQGDDVKKILTASL